MISLPPRQMYEPVPDPSIDREIAMWREQLMILKRDYEQHAQPIIDNIVRLEAQRRSWIIKRAPSLDPREA